MKSQYNQPTLVRNPTNYKTALEHTYNKMSIEEIRKAKPKSRLESFLRRKALEAK